jgi:shikimate dehydrogenase
MLLHQAGEQVRLMTGFEAPLAAMDAALATALAARAGLPVDDETHDRSASR